MSAALAVPRTALADVHGAPVALPDPHRLVHLQFRRFAGCPVCDLHLRSFALRHAEIAAAGIREAAVFHAPAEELLPHAGGIPFAIVPDPEKGLYRQFRVESSPRALLDPRAWPEIVRAVVHSLRARRPWPALHPKGGRFGLPADFLITPDGRVVASHYGTHAADHWSVDDVLSLARAAQSL